MDNFKLIRPWRTALLALALIAGPTLSACAENSQNVITRCDCGVVQSITPRTVQGGSNVGGTIIGAILGGVVGHQFGGGTGNSVMTAAGAVGGAAAGNKIASNQTHEVYDVVVMMDNGGQRNFTINSAQGIGIGDHVNVADGRMARF